MPKAPHYPIENFYTLPPATNRGGGDNTKLQPDHAAAETLKPMQVIDVHDVQRARVICASLRLTLNWIVAVRGSKIYRLT